MLRLPMQHARSIAEGSGAGGGDGGGETSEATSAIWPVREVMVL